MLRGLRRLVEVAEAVVGDVEVRPQALEEETPTGPIHPVPLSQEGGSRLGVRRLLN